MHGHPAAGSPGGDPRLFAGVVVAVGRVIREIAKIVSPARRGRAAAIHARRCGHGLQVPAVPAGVDVAGGGEVDPLLTRAALVELRCEERGVDGGGGPIVRKDILDLEVLGRHRATQTQGGLHGEDLIRIEPRS